MNHETSGACLVEGKLYAITNKYFYENPHPALRVLTFSRINPVDGQFYTGNKEQQISFKIFDSFNIMEAANAPLMYLGSEEFMIHPHPSGYSCPMSCCAEIMTNFYKFLWWKYVIHLIPRDVDELQLKQSPPYKA